MKPVNRIPTMPHPTIQECLLLALVSTLAACAVTPPYALKPDEKVASLEMIASSEATMCKNNTFYRIAASKGKSEVSIPSGERISVGTFMEFGGYNVSYSCRPFVSFIPKEGEKYALHNFVRGGQCFVEVVGLDGASPTGVKYEESIRPMHCSKDK